MTVFVFFSSCGVLQLWLRTYWICVGLMFMTAWWPHYRACFENPHSFYFTCIFLMYFLAKSVCSQIFSYVTPSLGLFPFNFLLEMLWFTDEQKLEPGLRPGSKTVENSKMDYSVYFFHWIILKHFRLVCKSDNLNWIVIHFLILKWMHSIRAEWFIVSRELRF